MARYQAIIGRSEEIDIVDTALQIPAKIDTGARRSAIHAQNIELVTENGKKVLTFSILGHPCSVISRELKTEDFSKVIVRSSNGVEEERYLIRLKIKIGPKIFKAGFTLADRSKNLFPILVGLEALDGRFLVDPSRASISEEQLIKEYGPRKAKALKDVE